MNTLVALLPVLPAGGRLFISPQLQVGLVLGDGVAGDVEGLGVGDGGGDVEGAGVDGHGVVIEGGKVVGLRAGELL